MADGLLSRRALVIVGVLIVLLLPLLTLLGGVSRGPMVVRLLPSDAETVSDVVQYPSPARFGMGQVGGAVRWQLPEMPEGDYDVVLTYCSGHGQAGSFAGMVEVSLGSGHRVPLTVTHTGGWSRFARIIAERVPIGAAAHVIEVSLKEKQPGVGVPLDLWRVDLVSADAKLPGTGQVVELSTEHGKFVQYIPFTAEKPIKLLVTVHGTMPENTVVVDALKQDLRFTDVAEEYGVILVAPAFETADYGGYAGPGGGYRGLFGRWVGADDFLNEIIDYYEDTYPSFGRKIYLHGHSAGGQFSSRYLVKHPDRVIAAVISSAGSFALPDPESPWPGGMAPLKREIYWAGYEAPREYYYEPDPEGWVKATQLPIAVIVGGLERNEDSQADPETYGKDHVQLAEDWVREMKALAYEKGVPCGVSLNVVEGIGHSGRQLGPHGFKTMFAKKPVR